MKFQSAKKNRDKIPIIGVMGGAQVSQDVYREAFDLGARIAEKGWILLNGGRDSGVMRASAEGAKSKGGITIGILPGNTPKQANPFIDIPIVTNLADARNLINVLSSDVVVACAGGAGTISEVALALKNKKAVITLNFIISNLFDNYLHQSLLWQSTTPEDCISRIEYLLNTF